MGSPSVIRSEPFGQRCSQSVRPQHASGRETTPGRWRASAVRDFALAVGRLDVATGTAKGVHVTVAAPHALRRLLPTYLAAARTALAGLSHRYGP